MNSISLPRIHLPLRWRFAGFLFPLLSFTACQSGETTLTRFEDSPVIESLLDSAPHFVVDTDIEPARWIATTRLGIPNDSLFLGQPLNMVAVGDSIYISEMYGHNIFAVGNDGYLSRRIGAQGKAPGEFNHIMGIDYNGSYMFVKDLERVQMFTEKFEFAGSFFNSSTGMQTGFSVSPDYIFLECIGIDWLVCPYSTSPPHAWIESVKFLPVLDLPDRSGENFNLVTVSPEGDRIAVAYTGLPYIFIYDDQIRHLKTIRFEGRRVRDFNPIVGPPNEAPGGMEPGTRAFMTTIKFLNSRYLLVNSKGGYILDLSENDYEVAVKMIFRPISDTKNITPGDFLLHKDYLYVSSPWEEYVYGYEFDLE
ncbi:MAG: hypothetical protein OXL40_01965 [Bacteroidota bacterium]|nr:hypothetical protein [Bacteroidota bacterium]